MWEKNAQIYVSRINYWHTHIRAEIEFGIIFNI